MRTPIAATLLPAVLVTALAAGCADSSTANLDRRLAALDGISEAELLRRMALSPAQVTDTDGVRRISFVQNWPDILIMTFRPIDAPTPNVPDLIDRHCIYTFTLKDGRVAGHSFAGSACGWGGYPMIMPA
jgi:hypothetical protein